MTNSKSTKLLAVKGNWADQKARLKEKLLLLNGTDLNYDDEKRSGKTKEELAAIIAAL